MPSNILWRGDAQPIAQVDTIVVGGSWSTGESATITCNGKNVTFTVGATETVAAVVAGLVAAWNAVTDIGEIMEMVASDDNPNILITARTAGKTFTITVSKDSGSGTISVSTTTTNSGPNDVAVAENYVGGSVPSSGDTLILQNSSSSLLYNLDALDGVKLVQYQSFTGTIGLPLYATYGQLSYREYRDTYLTIDGGSCVLGLGDGAGSGRIKIDFGAVTTAAVVYNAGNSIENSIPAILLKGTDADNTLIVMKGSVGTAFFAGEITTFNTISVGYITNQTSDSSVQCGGGATLGTIVQNGGSVSIQSNVTTYTQYAGKVVIGESATVGTGVFYGTVVDQSSGTWTTITINGVYDARQNPYAKTITNALLLGPNSEYHDPFDAVTLSAGLTLVGTTPEKVTLDIAPGKTLTIS